MWRICVRLLAIAAAFLGLGASASRATTWSAPESIDQLTPFGRPAYAEHIACPAASTCIAVGTFGSVMTSRDPAGGTQSWTSFVGANGGGEFHGLACPAPSLCVALDGDGFLVQSHDPSGGPGAWVPVRGPARSYDDVACAGAAPCVAVKGGPKAVIGTSTDPGGATPWQAAQTKLAFDLAGHVACPAASLCLAVDDSGNAIVSHDPAGGAATWHATAALPGGPALEALACPSTTLCVGVDPSGKIFTSTNPGDARASWSVGKLPPSAGIPLHITCFGSAFCLVTDDTGDVYVSTAPAQGARTWHRSARNVGSVLACASASLCVSADEQGRIAASVDPSATPSHWQATAPLAGLNALGAIACPSTRLCLAVDDANRLLASPDPAQASAWRSLRLRPASDTAPEDLLNVVSCASPRFCAVVGATGVATSDHPGGGPSDWHVSRIPSQPDSHEGNLIVPSGLSCPSRNFCAATFGPVILFSNHPAGGERAWGMFGTVNGDDDFSDISCPSARFCIAGDGNRVALSFAPRNPRSWRFAHVPGLGVACLPSRMCLTVDPAGEIYASRHPAVARSAWTRTLLRDAPLIKVACASQELCIALASTSSSLYVSRNPFARHPVWKPEQVVREPTILGSGPLVGIACQPGGACLAGDDRGHVFLGPSR